MPVALDDTTTLEARFRRLAIDKGWKKNSKRYAGERIRFFGRAVVEDFERMFGADENRLGAWQELCRFFEVGDNFSSIRRCKMALRGIFVNIIDLVDAYNAGTTPETFPSRGALAADIRETKRIFPKKDAKKNPLLKHFLVVVGFF